MRCWRCLQIAGLPWSGNHARPSDWNSEAKHPWQSWGTWGEDHYSVKIHWGAWTCWSWHQSVWRHWNEQWVAATRQGLMILACHEEILKERADSVSYQTSKLDFHFQGLLCRQFYWSKPYFMRKCLLHTLLFVRFHVLYEFFISINISLLMVKTACLEPPSLF